VHRRRRAQHKRQRRQPKLNLQYKIVSAGLGLSAPNSVSFLRAAGLSGRAVRNLWRLREERQGGTVFQEPYKPLKGASCAICD